MAKSNPYHYPKGGTSYTRALCGQWSQFTELKISKVSPTCEKCLEHLHKAQPPTTDNHDPAHVSHCCQAPVVVVGGDEGTNHYECTKCKQSCNGVAADNQVCRYCGLKGSRSYAGGHNCVSDTQASELDEVLYRLFSAGWSLHRASLDTRNSKALRSSEETAIQDAKAAFSRLLREAVTAAFKASTYQNVDGCAKYWSESGDYNATATHKFFPQEWFDERFMPALRKVLGK